MDKEQIERAREFLTKRAIRFQSADGANIYRKSSPMMLADFGQDEVARSRKTIAAELRKIDWAKMPGNIHPIMHRFIEKLEGEGRSSRT